MELAGVKVVYTDLEDLIAQLEFLRGNPAIGLKTQILPEKDWRLIAMIEEEEKGEEEKGKE